MSGSLDSTGRNKLWSPKLGIRFSPGPEPASLYPRLDVPRFVQTASASNITGAALKSDSFEYPVAIPVEDDLIALSTEPHGAGIQPRSQSAPAANTQTLYQPPSDTNQQTEDVAAELSLNSEKRDDLEKIEPPSTSLSFNISHDLFHAARAAKVGSSKSFWSHTMYQRTNDEGVVEKVKVHYCTSKHTMEEVCARHFLNQDILGFDLEWLPYATRGSGARENVSLIQIASADRIGLFHIAIFPKDDDLVSPTLRMILEDPNVSKVGVNIQGDCTRMKNNLGVQAQGIFELSHLYKQTKFIAAKTPQLINKVPVALSKQVQELLRLPMFKGDVVRSSNWMKRLDYRQLLYSASDAYAGLQLYHVLEAKRKELDPCPPRPHHVELGLPIPVVLPKPEPEEEKSADVSDDSFSSLDSDIEAELLNMPLPMPPPRKPRDPRVVAAEQKADEYRKSKKTPVSAQPAALRTYYMWHTNSDLNIKDIAAVLRDPPLKTNTVVSYILNAIVVEKMPYDKVRLKGEVFPLLDQRVKVGSRYGALVRNCDKE